MLERAKTALTTEMQQKKDNPYVQFIGRFMLNHLDSNPGSSEKILVEGKSIVKSLDAMEAAAKKKPRTGNCVMLTPTEGLEIVLNYYGIKDPLTPASVMSSMAAVMGVNAQASPAPIPVQPKIDFNIKLEDLL